MKFGEFCQVKSTAPAMGDRTSDEKDMAQPIHNPYDAPPLRGLGSVQGTLRVFVALQCWGFAAAHLHLGAQSAIARVLSTEFFLSSSDTATFDMIAAGLLTVGGVTCLIRPNWPVLSGLFFSQVLFVGAKIWLGEGGHPALVLMRNAIPIMAPVLLCFADFWPSPPKFSLGFWMAVATLARLAICAGFIGHGLDGLIQSQYGGDLVTASQGVLNQIAPGRFETREARVALEVIAAIQIGIGVALLCSRSRPAAALGAVLGLLVAGCYAMGLGMAGYPRALIHMAMGGLPAALWLFWVQATTEGELRYIPETQPMPSRRR